MRVVFYEVDMGIEDEVSRFIHEDVPLDINAYAVEDSGALSDTYGFVEYRVGGVLHRVSIWLTEEGECNVLDIAVEE